MANSHRRINTIKRSNIDDAVCIEAPVITEHFIGFFEYLLKKEQVGWRPKLNGLAFQSIEQQRVSWLERPFEETEFPSVVRRMVKDKTPSPDGFFMGFFQSC